jgi:6-phosphofructo-2-kinase/fructose-2,6-biphosphatase 2
MYNLSGQIGGDAELSSRGQQYALKLPELVRQSVGVSRQTLIFHSPPN